MKRTFSDGTTPTVVYCYDGRIQTLEGSPTRCPGATAPTGTLVKGRLTYVGNYSGAGSPISFTEFDYNNRGFVTLSRQTTAGGTSSPYLFGYTYNLTGGLKTMAYPSGHVVTNTFDNAGRIATVMGNGKTYATAQYYPHGAMKSMTHANGLVESVTVNNRLQPTSITAGSLPTLGFAYTPPRGSTTPTTAGNNGNIYEQTITPGGPSSIYVHYDYDGLNRIQWASGYSSGGADPTTNLNCPVSGSTASWCQHFALDAYGNRVVDNVVGMSRPPSQPTAFSASTNRVTAGGMTWNYDYNGNVMTDGAGSSFTYDAENRMRTGGGATYVYDGQGRRVSTTLNGTTTTFVYDAAGELAADYTTGTVASPCGLTCYLTADHLGSTRLVTNGSVAAVERVDYIPYGEEISFGAGTVPSGVVGYGGYVSGDVRQRFTGKERDAETGLDYFGARYMSSAQGRFTSADPKMIPDAFDDPQSWNKYTYVRNNPLRLVDPDGEDWKDKVSGFTNAWSTNQVAGFGRQTGNSDFQFGQKLGDIVSVATGAIETIVGGAGEVGGGALDLSVVGAPAGIAINVASTGVIVHGVAVAGIGLKNLENANAQENQSGTSGGDRAGKNFTKKGKAEVIEQNKQANDGKTVCQGCGQETTPAQQSKKGVSTPGNETRWITDIPSRRAETAVRQMETSCVVIVILRNLTSYPVSNREEAVADERVKILFELVRDDDGYPPADVEQLWAEPLGKGSFRIDNVPFFVKGISCEDVVAAIADSSGELRFQSLVAPSSHSTLRVIVFRESPDHRPLAERVSDLRSQLEKSGCSTELSHMPGMIAVDVSAVSMQNAITMLKAGEQADLWEYEEGAWRS